MKFGFTVNIDRKNKKNEKNEEQVETKEVIQTKTIESEEIQTKTIESEEIQITQIKESQNEKIYENIIESQSQDVKREKTKKIQIINNSQDNVFNKKMLLMFQKSNYDCKIKFKCMFSVETFKKCLKSTTSLIKNTITKSCNCVGNVINKSLTYVGNTIKKGYNNFKENLNSFVNSSKIYVATKYTNTKTAISRSIIVKKIKNINNSKVFIFTKKVLKQFIIYVFFIWICRRNTKIDKNSEEYKEEYIKNNATYSTEFDHLPILGDDAII
jgi:hypothetical protein